MERLVLDIVSMVVIGAMAVPVIIWIAVVLYTIRIGRRW
jgi:hypothetical protein